MERFFCIGVQKSGTTVLARVLDQHPDIACVSESFALAHRFQDSIFYPGSDKAKNHGFRPEDVARWSRTWQLQVRFNPLHRAASRLGHEAFRRRAFRRTMSEALDDFALRSGAQVIGDKWPQYTRYLDILLESFPDARFIYNVRDPRGIWASAQKFKKRNRGDLVLAEMLEQDERLQPYRSDPRFFFLRYEDLVISPEETARRLYAFLGCRFEESFLDYDPASDRYPDRWSWVPESRERLNPHHTRKWQSIVPAEKQAEIAVQAAAFMERWGYEVTPTPLADAPAQ